MGGNQTETKGRLGLNVLASGVPDCAAWYGPAKCVPELYQRLPSCGMPRFVLGINSQLVEIDSNHRLSRIVRNLASTNLIVIILWNMMVRMNMKLQYLLWLLLYALKMIYHMFGIG